MRVGSPGTPRGSWGTSPSRSRWRAYAVSRCCMTALSSRADLCRRPALPTPIIERTTIGPRHLVTLSRAKARRGLDGAVCPTGRRSYDCRPLPGVDPHRRPTVRRAARARRVLGVLSLGIALTCFLQAPGRIVADTKLDIAISPLTFLSHALHLWSPAQEFGDPIQAYGYFFPMGPFFVLGHAFDIPTWVIQRLWVAGLLSAGFWGVVRLAEGLGVGSRTSRVVAGLAFVFLSPVTLLGSTSSYILPFALLPWVMLPLVHGSPRGRPRVAAARSGVALLLMGGINRAAVLAGLPLPILWFLTRTPGRRRRQLLSWWVLAVFLALCGGVSPCCWRRSMGSTCSRSPSRRPPRQRRRLLRDPEGQSLLAGV